MMNQATVTLAILLMAPVMFVIVSGFEHALGAASRPADDADADRQAVLEANELFYTALNAMFRGDAEPFEGVWWHTDDIVYMGADGAYNVGWEQTYANWKKQAALNIGGEARTENVTVTVGQDLAMTNQYTVGVNTIENETAPIKLRATSVFRKKDGRWKMICHHVDVIPVLGEQMDDDR